MSRRASLSAALLAIAVAAVPVHGAADVAAPRAAGARGIVAALERSRASAVGRVEQVRALDVHGFAAALVVETPLTGGLERGQIVELAWEELARGRAPRFSENDRILVALERLPDASLWSQRFPEPGARERVLAVAAEGDAFLRRPTLGSVERLHHYLQLEPELRRSAAGASILAQLVAFAELPLARDAARHLTSWPGIDKFVDEGIAGSLVDGLVRPDGSDALRAELLELIVTRRLEAARPALELIVEGEEPAPSVVYVALARLDGGLTAERSSELLGRDALDLRVAGARYASGPEAVAQLRGLLRGDPAPEVRAAAVGRLVALERASALEPALASLDDEASLVRGAAAKALAGLGAPAVGPLVEVAKGGSPEAAQAAVLALRKTETRESLRALRSLASSHPDSQIRSLATLALGSMGEHH